MSYLGDKIREARKAAKLTQLQLAERIRVSNTSISNWEKGLSNPDPDTIQHLCWALNVQPNYFFSLDNSIQNYTPTNPGPASPFSVSIEEQILIEQFRLLDERGQAVVLAILQHEYDHIDDNMTSEYDRGYEDGRENALDDIKYMPDDWDDM